MTPTPELPCTLIRPDRRGYSVFRDLALYWRVLAWLAWRDVLVRYKQTVFGVLWALIRPLATMAILTVVFGRLAKMPGEGGSYSILVLAGVLPWMFFAGTVNEAGNSLLANVNLVGKVYFPRVILPLSTLLVTLVDFLIGIVLLIGLQVVLGEPLTWRLLTLPVWVTWAVLAALGPGMCVAALVVKYRDFRFVMPFVLQFGLYLSPVGFSSRVVPEEWRLWYALNPMAGVIDGFRWAVCGAPPLSFQTAAISVATSLILLGIGWRHFQRSERDFADQI